MYKLCPLPQKSVVLKQKSVVSVNSHFLTSFVKSLLYLLGILSFELPLIRCFISRVEFTVLENSVTRKVEQKVAKFYQKVAKKVAKLENRFTQVLNQF